MVEYVDRKGTDCTKWDGQKKMFGEENLQGMWVADMDFKVPESVTEALKKYVDLGVFGYYTIPESYYQSFISWEKRRHNVNVDKTWIRFSPGVVAAFHWIVQFMTKPGDAVIVQTPVYYPFLNAVRNNGRKLVCSDLINENGIYTIDYLDFERKIQKNQVKLFILCSPHNPVGRVWREDELSRIFEICKKYNVYIIADEIHQDLVFGDSRHVSSLLFDDYADRIITLTAPSKTFNLAGCQNSIIVIPDGKLREKWDAFTLGIRVQSGNPFGYIAASAAYSSGESWLEEIKQIIYANYIYLKKEMEQKAPGIVVSPLEGTYLVWINMGKYLQKEEMAEYMQKKCELALDYGEWFGGERFGTFVRMNLATSKENVNKALTRICLSIKTIHS